MKTLRYLLFWFLIPLSIWAQEAPRVHVVRPGETLYRIARTYGLSVEELKALNGLKDNTLRVGQRLVVARPEPKPEVRRAVPREHVVRPGETLYSIAFRYGVSVDSLKALNDLEGVVVLSPGQKLRLPAPPRRLEVRLHRVGQGETLGRIARRYGVSVRDIQRFNQLQGTTIRVGQRLRIPVEVERPPVDHPLEVPPDTVGAVLIFPPTYAGRVMAGGEPYRPEDLVASHPEWPFQEVVLLTAPETGRSVFVRIADRGPWQAGYIMEISEAAARALGISPGARVEVRRVAR